MCDLNRVSNLLIAAQAAFLAVLITLGIAVINAASLFAAAANVVLMAIVIVAAGVATGLLGGAIAELDKCRGGPCDRELNNLRGQLVTLTVSFGIFTAMLIGITVVAAIPFAGAVAVGALLAFGVNVSLVFAGIMETILLASIRSFNECQQRNNAPTISGFITVLIIAVIIVIVVFSVAGGLSGKVPWNIFFEWT